MEASKSAGRRARCTAFEGLRHLASGALDDVVRAAKTAFDRSATSSILIFDDTTGEQVDVDYSGSEAEVMRAFGARESARSREAAPEPDPAPRGPGRPRLGVVAREVTLLPRHWQWLNGQPGGASVALRRLVDEARRASVGRDGARRAQEVAYRFMSALAGNLPGFEEAIRALFASDGTRFDAQIAEWPEDIRTYTRTLATGAFESEVGR